MRPGRRSGRDATAAHCSSSCPQAVGRSMSPAQLLGAAICLQGCPGVRGRLCLSNPAAARPPWAVGARAVARRGAQLNLWIARLAAACGLQLTRHRRCRGRSSPLGCRRHRRPGAFLCAPPLHRPLAPVSILLHAGPPPRHAPAMMNGTPRASGTPRGGTPRSGSPLGAAAPKAFVTLAIIASWYCSNIGGVRGAQRQRLTACARALQRWLRSNAFETAPRPPGGPTPLSVLALPHPTLPRPP